MTGTAACEPFEMEVHGRRTQKGTRPPCQTGTSQGAFLTHTANVGEPNGSIAAVLCSAATLARAGGARRRFREVPRGRS